MNKIQKVLFSGKTHTNVSSSTADGHVNVDMRLSSPDGTEQVFAAIPHHPTAERMFAGAWSACYIGALGLVAAQKRVTLPADLSVEIEVDLVQAGNEFFLQARFNIRMPGIEREVAEKIAHAAHEICPYSKATKGNIDVAVNVTTS